jgi:hypothetical protein
VLHIATVHYRSPRWIEVQGEHLREHIKVPFQTWSSLEKIDPSYARHFDHVVEQRGTHAAKLNHLAMEITHEAADADILMFLDGDAFPIADPMPLIEDSLAKAPLLAVRRAENVDEPQPHPCFCVTTVAAWRTLPGDWTAGWTWTGAHGGPTSDVGGNLLRRLELTNTPWIELLRSNRRNLHPLYFAIYGDVIYHHGAGFRTGELSPVDRAQSPPPLLAGTPLQSLARPFNGWRWQRWERRVSRSLLAQSNALYERIRSGEGSWLAELTGEPERA